MCDWRPWSDGASETLGCSERARAAKGLIPRTRAFVYGLGALRQSGRGSGMRGRISLHARRAFRASSVLLHGIQSAAVSVQYALKCMYNIKSTVDALRMGRGQEPPQSRKTQAHIREGQFGFRGSSAAKHSGPNCRGGGAMADAWNGVWHGVACGPTYRDEASGEVIRLISARKANAHEKRVYAKSQRRPGG